jgi:hypothetical protein
MGSGGVAVHHVSSTLCHSRRIPRHSTDVIAVISAGVELVHPGEDLAGAGLQNDPAASDEAARITLSRTEAVIKDAASSDPDL